MKILLLGDSITAGYGLDEADSLPVQLQQRLTAEGLKVRVINGGVSGDTMAQGQARLDWLLQDDPQIVVVALGANDALRALPPEQTAQALDTILGTLRQRGIATLLVGMKAPRNLGPLYAVQFDPVFPAAAKKYDVPFYPFLLEGVALRPELNQEDGIHPNAAGIRRIVDGLAPLLQKMVRQMSLG
jgi:acyl-CoA thioesterase-1